MSVEEIAAGAFGFAASQRPAEEMIATHCPAATHRLHRGPSCAGVSLLDETMKD